MTLVNDCVGDLLEQRKVERENVTNDGFNKIYQNHQKIFPSINRLSCSLYFLLDLEDVAEKELLNMTK